MNFISRASKITAIASSAGLRATRLLRKHPTSVLSIAIAFFLGIMALFYIDEHMGTLAASKPPTAQAIIVNTSDATKVMGRVSFLETSQGMQIEAKLDNASNATPGEHGFHIHEFGSCENEAKAAGGHFNPDSVKHGKLISDGFAQAHAGDLGNIVISNNGTATLSQTLPEVRLSGGKYPIAGRAVILHEKNDDFGQPVGNAGGRIGCGTITFTGS